MKSKIKKLDGTAREFEIEMPKEKVEEVFNQILKDIRKTAVFPGFRPGNAPLDLIRKRHHKEAMDEVKQKLIPQAYEEALTKHEVNPVSYPEISDIDINPKGALTFRAKVDAYPNVVFANYKGLKVMAKKVDVNDKEINEALERVRNLYAEFHDITRPLAKGDFTVCDIETFINGKPISQKRKNAWIEVDKEASMLGLGEELLNLKKGDKKDVEMVLPENFFDKNYAGKKALFHIEINQTKERKLPLLDDELGKKMGKNNLKELSEELKAQLFAKKEANSKVEQKNQIMEQLLKNSSFDLPVSMVKRQFKVLMERIEEELKEKGVASEAIASHKEKLNLQVMKEAENKVRLYFILDEISNHEKIDVVDEDVDEWLRALADSYGQSFDNVKKYYEDHNLMGGLKEQLKEDKTLDFLLEEAIVE